MRPCYNYIVYCGVCYRFDINNAKVSTFTAASSRFTIGNLVIDEESMDRVYDKINAINMKNNRSNVNIVGFTSPTNTQPGNFVFLGRKYEFRDLYDLLCILEQLPNNFCVRRASSYLTTFRLFIKNIAQYKPVNYIKGDPCFTYNGNSYFVYSDVIRRLFPDADMSSADYTSILRDINIKLVLNYSGDKIVVLENGDIILRGKSYLLKKSMIGKYYLSGSIYELFGTRDFNTINSKIMQHLPSGMKRIGVFPEFDDINRLYEFVHNVTNLELSFKEQDKNGE